jgi:hypothetical protein
MGITADPFHKVRKYFCDKRRLNIGSHLTKGTKTSEHVIFKESGYTEFER